MNHKCWTPDQCSRTIGPTVLVVLKSNIDGKKIYHASIKNILPLSSSSLSGLLWTQLTIVFFQTFCTVSIRFQKSFIQRFSASSSLFIFPPWNCVSAIILNLHLPPRHVCDRMNCERERKRKGICSIFFSWISSQRKLIRLIDSPAHNIPLFLQPPLFHPTYGH